MDEPEPDGEGEDGGGNQGEHRDSGQAEEERDLARAAAPLRCNGAGGCRHGASDEQEGSAHMECEQPLEAIHRRERTLTGGWIHATATSSC